MPRPNVPTGATFHAGSRLEGAHPHPYRCVTMDGLPTGTITFLMTDIEGSTRLWEAHPEHALGMFARHDELVEGAVTGHAGQVIGARGEGDSRFAVFPEARDAVAAAAAIVRGILNEPWQPVPLRVRIGVHTGLAHLRADDYYGSDVNRCARIRSLAAGGQVLVSGNTVSLVGDALPDGVRLRDLGEHRLKDLSRPERIYQLAADDLPSDFPPLRSLSSYRTNLPTQTTSFIGRDEEIEEVTKAIEAARLVTLAGGGGVGKTRLALQVASGMLDRFVDGVWFVPLAALSDPELVAGQVAQSLGLPEEPGRDELDAIANHLRAHTTLVVLDNCEHLLASCAELCKALLEACPDLRVLATSREPLGVSGEQLWRVPTLPAPDARSALPAEALLEFESVRLFVDRAVLASPRFLLTHDNAVAVARICGGLDGIPLAIELAAARVRVITPGEIADRLDDRFGLLTGGARTGLRHHRTLRATIDWSHDLLSDEERTFFRRASVFAARFRLEAAEDVACDGLSADVLDLVSSLVDRSLLLATDDDGTMRYEMLSTVREYGLERLSEAGEDAAIRARHAAHFAALAARAELIGPAEAEWLARLEAEHDDLRAALEWSFRSEPETGLATAGRLWRFWMVHGHHREGRRMLEAALRAAPADAPSRRRALRGLGIMAVKLGDHAVARDVFEECLALARARGGEPEVAGSLADLGNALLAQGDLTGARAYLSEGMGILRRLGDERGAATVLVNLGNLTYRLGDYAGAREMYEEALEIRRRFGDRGAVAALLGNLGVVADVTGDDDRAIELQEEALGIRRELGDRGGIANSLGNLASLALARGEVERARALSEETLALFRALGDRSDIAMALLTLADVVGGDADARPLYEEALAIAHELGERAPAGFALEGIARLAIGDGRHARGATLLAAANRLHAETGNRLTAEERARTDAALAAARAALGSEAYEAAVERGRDMDMEEALTLATGE